MSQRGIQREPKEVKGEPKGARREPMQAKREPLGGPGPAWAATEPTSTKNPVDCAHSGLHFVPFLVCCGALCRVVSGSDARKRISLEL